MFYCKISGINLQVEIYEILISHLKHICCVSVCLCACVHAIEIFFGCTFFVERIQGNVTHIFCAERGV